MSVPAAYLGIIVIWATTPLAIKWSGMDAGFLFGVSARMGIGVAICLLLVMLLRHPLPLERRAVWSYLVAGLSIFAAMLSIYWAAQQIPSGLISVLFGLTPFATGIMAAQWLTEKTLTPLRLLGMALGVAGLALIFLSNGTREGANLSGVAAVLFAVTVHSASSVWLKRIGAGLSPLSLNSGALLVATPLFFLVWWGADGPASAPLTLTRGMWAIVYLGVFGTAIGFNLYYYVLHHVTAGAVSLITLITPVLALWLGSVLNGEQLQPVVWLGSGTILTGLMLYQWGEQLYARVVPGRLDI